MNKVGSGPANLLSRENPICTNPNYRWKDWIQKQSEKDAHRTTTVHSAFRTGTLLAHYMTLEYARHPVLRSSHHCSHLREHAEHTSDVHHGFGATVGVLTRSECMHSVLPYCLTRLPFHITKTPEVRAYQISKQFSTNRCRQA